MSSSQSTLTVEDLNRLLFNMEYNDYGESSSQFLAACRLIVSTNRSAAALSMNDDPKQFSNPQPDTSSLFASVIGDITPAAAAVLGESPAIETPYLDSSMTPYSHTPATAFTPYTPYTPATAFTPSLSDIQGSPHFSPCIEGHDISMAHYLPLECSQVAASVADGNNWFGEPTSSTPATFSGDPSQLVLDKSKDTPAMNSSRLAWHDEPAAEDSNMLFPPLDEDDNADPYPTTITDNQHDFLNTLMGFDFGVEQHQQQYDQQQSSQNNNNEDEKQEVQEENKESSPQQEEPQAKEHIEDKSSKKKQASSRKRPNTATDSSNAKRRRSAASDANAKRYECPICKTCFNRRYNLGTHIKTHDKNRKKEFECTLCPKSFDRRHDRDRHIATVHLGERSYACGRCQAAFSRKDALTRHIDQKHGVV
ncbi:hypothetical protein K492DRAFT_172970 [Lichtheimia hyalospora FSU 10163]|nr:hypothetical protein K492DRAFT_172970 [Lichtheimia hyalospora FSU 10163]